MRFGSVCSGIEAASVAWDPLGWEPAFVSEIEGFPCHLLHHRQCVGTPLFLPDPTKVWGEGYTVLSKQQTADIKHRKANIRAASELPKGGTVPNFGDMTQFKEWPDATIDLLVGGTPCQSFSVAGLRKGLDDPRGNLALTFCAIADRYKPRWILWENVPGVLSSGQGRDFGSLLGAMVELGYGFAYRVLDAQYVRVDGFERAVPQRRRRLFVVGYLGDWRRAAAVLFEQESLRGDPAPSRKAGQGAAPTLSARPSGGGGLGTDFDLDGGLVAADVAPTLNAHFGSKMGLENQHINGGCGLFVAAPLAFDCKASGRNGFCVSDEIAPTLRAMGHASSHQNAGGQVAVSDKYVVRRLMPMECERLQGFPDGYTAVPWRGKGSEFCPDGPRYKALGNSMAVNVMRWLGARIEQVEQLIKEGAI